MPTDQSPTCRIAPADLPAESILFGSGTAMAQIRQTVESISATDRPVLIQGESGTGKELVARFVHVRSKRQAAPFIRVNCAALPSTLVEAELFGYEQDRFPETGHARTGILEAADGGTLFLDEIGALAPGLQEKLLEFLRGAGYTKMGGLQRRYASVRTICACNTNLGEAVDRGRFCKDLYDRIVSVSIQLPALRDRKSDIPQLCDFFISKLAARFRRPRLRLSSTTLRLLEQWDWPGNVRELENWMARVVILGDDAALSTELKKRIDAYAEAGERDHRNVIEGLHWESSVTAPVRKVLKVKRRIRGKMAADRHVGYRSLTYKLREVGIPRRRSHKGHHQPS